MSYLTRFFVLSFCLLLPFQLLAWNALGHMVVANIAYQNLQPNAKANVDKLIVNFSKEYPHYTSIMQMSNWLDAIRSQRIELFTRWHYIDVPFTTENSIPLKNTVTSDNASWAVSHIKIILQNHHANIYEHSRFLAFMVHIVGDLHQPLHTVTRLSKVHPDGDKGGNLLRVKFNGKKIKLHKLWDDGLGLLQEDANITNANRIANMLMTQYPQRYFGVKSQDLTPSTWEKEGMHNALTYVYKVKETEEVSAEYLTQGKLVIQEQLTLAGYRLANILNQIFC